MLSDRLKESSSYPEGACVKITPKGTYTHLYTDPLSFCMDQ